MKEFPCNLNIQEMRDKIEEFRAGSEGLLSDFPVALLYVFGSVGRAMRGGRVTAFSDLDLAVLFTKEVNPSEHVGLRQKLYALFEGFFGRPDIDVLVLNRAGPLLRYKVLKDGYLLFAQDRRTQLEFEVGTRREYFDTAWIRKVQHETFLERVKRGEGFGRSGQGSAAPKEVRGVRDYLKGVSGDRPDQVPV